MIDPSINSLLEKVDSRYALCIITGKRARQLISGAQKHTKCTSLNAVTLASCEINEGTVFYTKKKTV